MLHGFPGAAGRPSPAIRVPRRWQQRQLQLLRARMREAEVGGAMVAKTPHRWGVECRRDSVQTVGVPAGLAASDPGRWSSFLSHAALVQKGICPSLLLLLLRQSLVVVGELLAGAARHCLLPARVVAVAVAFGWVFGDPDATAERVRWGRRRVVVVVSPLVIVH